MQLHAAFLTIHQRVGNSPISVAAAEILQGAESSCASMLPLHSSLSLVRDEDGHWRLVNPVTEGRSKLNDLLRELFCRNPCQNSQVARRLGHIYSNWCSSWQLECGAKTAEAAVGWLLRVCYAMSFTVRTQTQACFDADSSLLAAMPLDSGKH